jgi:hypothetical protein
MCQLGILIRPAIHLAAVHCLVLLFLNSLILLVLRCSGAHESTQQDWILLIKPETLPFAWRRICHRYQIGTKPSF